MLFNNSSYLNFIRTFSGREGSDSLFNKRNGLLIANAYFGTNTSFPQGYNNQYAIVMPLTTGYNISVIMRGVGNVVAEALSREEGEAVMAGESVLISLAVTKESESATMSGVGNFISQAQVEEVLEAIIDAGARPSAFDIAQEVWGGLAVNFKATGSMGEKVNDAGDPWGIDVSGTYTNEQAGAIINKILQIAKFLQVK